MHTHRHAHAYEKKPPYEKQTGSEVQAKDLEKIVEFFNVVLILSDLLAAGKKWLGVQTSLISCKLPLCISHFSLLYI